MALLLWQALNRSLSSIILLQPSIGALSTLKHLLACQSVDVKIMLLASALLRCSAYRIKWVEGFVQGVLPVLDFAVKWTSNGLTTPRVWFPPWTCCRSIQLLIVWDLCLPSSDGYLVEQKLHLDGSNCLHTLYFPQGYETVDEVCSNTKKGIVENGCRYRTLSCESTARSSVTFYDDRGVCDWPVVLRQHLMRQPIGYFLTISTLQSVLPPCHLFSTCMITEFWVDKWANDWTVLPLPSGVSYVCLS